MLTHKADDPEASFDPLILETEILAAVASLRRKPGQPPAPEEERRVGRADRRLAPAEESNRWDGQLRRRGVVDRRAVR